MYLGSIQKEPFFHFELIYTYIFLFQASNKHKERLTATALYICLSFLIFTSPTGIYILLARLNGWNVHKPESVRMANTFIMFV